jgi:thiamine kinase-like enzyme
MKVKDYVIKRLGLSSNSSKVKVKAEVESYSNAVYTISTGSRSFILKIVSDPVINERKIAEKEVALLKKFKRIAPKVILLDSFEGHPAIFMERLKGKSLSESKKTAWDLKESARLLVQIHSARIEPKLVELLSRKYEKVPQENLGTTVQWLRKFKRESPIKSKIIAQYRRLHKYYVDSGLSFRPVLCHGDFKLGNVIKSGSKLKVIDWETAIIGDPAYDLAVFFYTSDFERSKKLLSERQKRLFLNSYLALRPDPTLARRIGVYYKLAMLQSLCWSVRSFLGYGQKGRLGSINSSLKRIEKLKL